MRNQIAFILINHRFRNAIKYTKTYPSADCNTDHTCISVKLKGIHKLETNKKINTRSSLLKDLQAREEFGASMNQNIRQNIYQQETLSTLE